MFHYIVILSFRQNMRSMQDHEIQFRGQDAIGGYSSPGIVLHLATISATRKLLRIGISPSPRMWRSRGRLQDASQARVFSLNATDPLGHQKQQELH